MPSNLLLHVSFPRRRESSVVQKREFGGAIIANDGFDEDAAVAVLREGVADAVAFGRAYIANPDLVARLRHGAELNTVDSSTIYGLGARGYTDYPMLVS